jgi:diacylglycerol O-acyltransferase / wax synthase
VIIISPLRLNEAGSGVCRFAMSKIYDLEKTKKICKDFNISFNDYVMCVISKAVKEWKDFCEKNKNFENFENFSCFIPIGRKGIPKDTNDLQINNEVYGIYIRMPLIDNFLKEYKKVVQVLRNSLKSLGFVSAATRFCRIGVSLLPRVFQLYLGEKFLNNVDLIVSNVPGPTEPLYYAGCKLKMIAPIISTRNARSFLPIISYNKQFRFILSVDVESKIDDGMFIDFIEKEIDRNANGRISY